NAPTAIFVANLNGSSIEEVDVVFEEGAVEVISTQILLTGETTDNQCFGETIGSVNVNLIGGQPDYQIEWTGPDNFSSNDLNIDNLSAGTYTVTITDSFGTSATESFEINAPTTPLSVEGITAQQNDCDVPSGEIEVIISGGTTPYTYDFGTGFSENTSVQNLLSGDYSITILDANNCPLDTVATVGQTLPNLISLGQDTAICSNEDLLLSIDDINGTITWFQDGNDLGNNTNALEIFETGTYMIQLINEFGCFSEDSVQVELKELEYTISPDTVIFRGMSVPLLANGGVDYLWEPVEFLSCETCPNPIAAPLTGTSFTVEISTPNGCFASDSVFVDISNELELVIPPVNFISPNGDGKNDQLVFEGLEMFPQNSLIIYNRWGTKIYNAINYQQNGTFWDATYNGKELPAGAYFYILKVDANGTEIRTSLVIAR
ncbi:MAG: gliding motility-associated-like protein, partial [Saprospiraceae bacterium]